MASRLFYNCKWCNKKYTRVDKYIEHARQTHNETVDKATIPPPGPIQKLPIPPATILRAEIKEHELSATETKVPLNGIAGHTECIVCCDKTVNAAIIPCGHTFACHDCTSKLGTCSICRGPVDSCIKLYVS